MQPPPDRLDFTGLTASACHAEAFAGGLATRNWTIRQGGSRRSHLLVIASRSGVGVLRETRVAFEGPAVLWLPSETEGELQVQAGARGYVVSISDDVLTRTVAGSAEAIHLRRTTDRLVMLSGSQIKPVFNPIAHACEMLVAELKTPGRGSMTMMSSQVLQLCIHLWRCASVDDADNDIALRGDGPRLIGNFLQLVELHYRDGWPVTRYAAELGVTDDKLHAHCKREKGRSPLSMIHDRLISEACTRLRQLDLTVAQIGYGLGFRDAGYFNRFFRKHVNTSPGVFRRRARLEELRRKPTYAEWP